MKIESSPLQLNPLKLAVQWSSAEIIKLWIHSKTTRFWNFFNLCRLTLIFRVGWKHCLEGYRKRETPALQFMMNSIKFFSVLRDIWTCNICYTICKTSLWILDCESYSSLTIFKLLYLNYYVSNIGNLLYLLDYVSIKQYLKLRIFNT